MRKGLTTLMTVALTLVSMQAMANAPLVKDFPIVIIGGSTGPTQTTKFVYPDAIDLMAMATDDNTTSANLIWSYEIVGTPKYKINGDDPINSSTENGITPPTAKRIRTQMNGISGANEVNPDGKINTISIRNVSLAPYTGTGATPTVGFIDGQAVTFWCSDGNLATSNTVMFWTDNYAGGWNRLSTKGANWKTEKSEAFNGVFWGKNSGDMWLGSITTKTLNGRGMCFEVTPGGDNMGAVISPPAFFALAKNTVYKIRAKMNCSQTTPGKTPFWNLIVDNWNGDATKGLNLYGLDAYFLDNSGSANAVLNTPNGTEVVLYWAPLPFQTTQWNAANGVFSATFGGRRDPFVRFRVMDVVSGNSLGNETKFGSICLQSLTVESIPYSAVQVVNTPISITKPQAASNTVAGGNMTVSSFLGTIVSYANNELRLTPQGTGVSDELVTIVPAADLRGTLAPPFSNLADDWPLTWKSNKIYQMDMTLLAPDTNSQAHPFDVIWMHLEPPTNEINVNSYVTSYLGLGSPKTGTPQTYTFFYNTQNETAVSTPAALHFLRWRVRFGNATNLKFPNGTSDATNNGAVILRTLTVKEITFQ